MTLTISIPEDAEPKLLQRADASGQDIRGYVEQLIANDVAALAVGPSLDDQYERGYASIPENIDDVTAMLPHLAVDPLNAGEWA